MDFLKDLIANDHLSVSGDKVAVKPLARQAYTVFPITPEDRVLRISVEEYVGLKLRMYQFSKDLSGLEYFERLPALQLTRSAPIKFPQETIRAAIGELTAMLENADA